MDSIGTGAIDRRLAIGGALAAVGLAWPARQVSVRVIIQRGVVGGGEVQFDAGVAHVSLFASSLAFEGEDGASAPIFAGSVRWVDETVGLTLESTQITRYENLNLAEGEGRHIEGLMLAGDNGEQPFTMDVVDLGAPGMGVDQITLVVGADAAVAVGEATPGAEPSFTYTAQGTLVSGDLQEVDFAFDPEAGSVTPAPPAQ